MIDLHSHLLPGIDDGPATMEQSVEMAAMAVEEGTTHLLLTPHIIPGRYNNTRETIDTVFEAFRHEIAMRDISLQLAFAAEVRLDPVIMNMIEAASIPFLGRDGEYDLLLLEFPHDTVPQGSMELVQWLLTRFIKPVIAHPERNRSVLAKPATIKPFIDAGCLLQITAGSLTGVFGRGPDKLARKFLKQDQVSLIASDAHNVEKRRPGLKQARQAAEKIVGLETSWKLVRDNPAKFTAGMFQA